MNLQRLWFGCLCLLSATAEAGSLSLLEAAVAKWAEETDRWSLVQHVREYRGDQLRETRVERFDPSEPDASRWQLLEVNGRAPTAAENRAFNARKNAKPRASFEAPSHYIDFARVTIIEETDDAVLFDVPLRSNVSLLVPFEDVTARVWIDKATSTITHVDLGLRRELRIAFGLAKVTQLDLALSLTDAAPDSDDDGPASPEGHASATIKKFGRRVEITWSAFTRVGESAQ